MMLVWCAAKSYTHRVGRTARGGASGTALSLFCERNAQEQAVLAEVSVELITFELAYIP